MNIKSLTKQQLYDKLNETVKENRKLEELNSKLQKKLDRQSGTFIHLYKAINVNNDYLNDLTSRTSFVRVSVFHEPDGTICHGEIRDFADGNRCCIQRFIKKDESGIYVTIDFFKRKQIGD